MGAHKYRLTRIATALLLISLAISVATWITLRFSTPVALFSGKGFSRLTLDRAGNVLDLQIAPDERYRVPIHLDDIPNACINAALAYEDSRYFYHPGVDPLSLLRALRAYGASQAGGASTITMQVVRLRLGLHTRSLRGKLEQIWKALVVERHFSKREILESYFTFAPYGGGVEGIAAASSLYFKKAPSGLSAAECAALAVLPQSPTDRFGFYGAGFDASYRRLVTRLGLPESESALNFPSRESIDPPHLARHLTSKVLSSGGLITTTIDSNLQGDLESLLKEYITRRANLGLKNGALLVANGAIGEVLGYVGSREYSDRSLGGFVDGVRAKRSPGSLLKPFVYARAVSEGLIIPDSVLQDIPIKLTSYEPENFERDFLGLISAREALVKSRNIPALLLNTRLSGDGLYSLLKSAGIPLPRSPEYYGSAVVLGGIEISLFDTVRLYSAFVRLGEVTPLALTRNNNHASSYASTPGIVIFSPESAYLTRQMLATNPPPPGFSARGIAWKTGSSSGARDAWAVGIVGSLIVGVWLGNFDGTPNSNFVGRDLAGPLLFEIAERLRTSSQYAALTRTAPSPHGLNLARERICSTSGLLSTPQCPHTKTAVMVPGVSPIKTCDIHRLGQDGANSREVHSSEVTEHLHSVGVLSGADQHLATSSPKMPPRIISPEALVEYKIEFSKMGETELEFRANLDGEVSRVFWYVDGAFVGDTAPGRSFFWRASPGRVTVRVVDSLGGSDAVGITVGVQAG